MFERLKLLKRRKDVNLSPEESEGLADRLEANCVTDQDRDRLVQVIRATTQVTDDTQNRNLTFTRLPICLWAPEHQEASLQKVVNFVCERAEEAINWYLEKKDKKRWWAQRLRVMVIVLTIAAAAIPALAEFFEFKGSWAYVVLVIAGGLITFDKFFGFSSAWMRFLTTEMTIQHKLSKFLWDWEIRRAHWQGAPPPTFEDITSMLEHCSAFMEEVRDILKDEMEQWQQEFQTALKDVEAAAKAQRDAVQAQLQASRPGGLNLKVTNGDQCTGPWSVHIDNRPAGDYQGTGAALTGLSPGIHQLQVNGDINGQQKTDHKAVDVSAGTIKSEELTLA